MSVTTHVKSGIAHELAEEELKTTHQNSMPLNLALLHIAGIARLPKGKANGCRKILYKVQVVLFQASGFPLILRQVMALYRPLLERPGHLYLLTPWSRVLLEKLTSCCS
jgi:hypothetical protein